MEVNEWSIPFSPREYFKNKKNEEFLFWSSGFLCHGLPSSLGHVSQRGRPYVALSPLKKRGERWKRRREKKRKETRRRVGSNAYTAGGTRRREVLLSGRGPLSSRWWQVSVAALVAENGRRFSPETSLLSAISRACTRGCGIRVRRVPSTSDKSASAGGGGWRPGRCIARPRE